jgi:hypothetical protein
MKKGRLGPTNSLRTKRPENRQACERVFYTFHSQDQVGLLACWSLRVAASSVSKSCSDGVDADGAAVFAACFFFPMGTVDSC